MPEKYLSQILGITSNTVIQISDVLWLTAVHIMLLKAYVSLKYSYDKQIHKCIHLIKLNLILLEFRASERLS